MIPPHIDEEIAKRGTPEQRAAARRRLQVSAGLRARRLVVSPHAAQTPGILTRRTYTADHTEQLRARLVRDEGAPAAGDADIDDIHQHVGELWAFLREVFGRDSIDDAGYVLIATGHFGTDFDNAFWDGDEFACGHPKIFVTMTGRTIVYHEEIHGVTQFLGGLNYHSQPGALNEHFSDVMAVCAEQRVLGQTAAAASWLVGAECFEGSPALQGRAIRALKDPPAYDDPLIGRDPSRSHMRDLYTGFDDQGGVHINCGIPSRAFYEAAVGIGGFAWEKVGQIWFRAFDTLSPSAQFRDAAVATVRTAGQMYGEGGLEQQAVQNGWRVVGIDVGGEVPVEDPSDCEEDVLAFLREPTLRQALRSAAGHRVAARARALLR